MIKAVVVSALAALLLQTGHGQDMGKPPSFEVASITPCKPGTRENPLLHMGAVQFVSPGGRFNATAIPLKYLIEWAYDIQPAQHTGGPSWIDSEYYDIAAKAEGNPTTRQVKLMVQSLLAERFKLKFHREQRILSAYVISTGNATSAKLSPAKEGETRAMHLEPKTGADQKIVAYRVTATRYSIADLATVFARQMQGVIVDQTGLTGEYDFTLDLVPDENRPNPVDPSLLITALRDQVGLSLKSQKTPVDVLVIESAERVAAGN
jgi:uncharacterized protein (TIGR03435 family)